MKVSLVVASGVHQGKTIPVAGPQFLIGREEGCQLRPASPAISKRHCAIRVRDGKVFVEDMGSTNGTFVNDEPTEGEREVAAGDRLRVGPLDFTVNLAPARASDSTPLPDALRAVAETTGAARLTPGAARPAAKAGGSSQSIPAVPPAPKPQPAATAKGGDDDIADMLLGMDEDDPNPSDVPGGSTVMNLSPVDADKLADAQKAIDPKKVPTQAQSSAAASDLLRKYMRRPK